MTTGRSFGIDFFARPCLTVAPELLGAYLVQRGADPNGSDPVLRSTFAALPKLYRGVTIQLRTHLRLREPNLSRSAGPDGKCQARALDPSSQGGPMDWALVTARHGRRS